MGLAKPPFINEDLKSGYEIELLELIFQEAQIPIETLNMSNSRMLHEFEQKKVDVMINTNAQIEDRYPTSVPYIVYQNVAVAKKLIKHKVNSIEDLKDLKIGAFQNAKKLLGPDYQKIAENSKNYREFAQQQAQVQMLQAERIDVAVMEKMIFKAYAEQLKLDPDQYLLYRIFPENRYSTAFHDEKIRDEFNKAFQKAKTSGKVEVLAKQYGLNLN